MLKYCADGAFGFFACFLVLFIQFPVGAKGHKDILHIVPIGQGQELLTGKFISLIRHCMYSITKRRSNVGVSGLLNRSSSKTVGLHT